mmetsp:Transcript_49340/g.141859  ORF Transcript_49340/g.141859 Transcript_49340/m.141859 type:complete len:165 (+) Transcript_49340:414-908(+)
MPPRINLSFDLESQIATARSQSAGTGVPRTGGAGGGSARGAGPRRAELATTSSMGVEMALVQLMRLFSVRSSGTGASAAGGCCSFHLRIARLQEGMTSLAGLPCARGFQARVVAQCGRCGLLADISAAREARSVRCFACQAPVQVDRQRAPSVGATTARRMVTL